MIEAAVILPDAPAIPGLAFRPFDPTRDYPGLVDLIRGGIFRGEKRSRLRWNCRRSGAMRIAEMNWMQVEQHVTRDRRAVLPPGIPRLAVEAGATDGWRKYVGAVDDPHAGVIGIDRYGESAPAGVLFKYFGFTSEHVADAARRIVGTTA
jgi:hypothetical protein